MTNFDKNRLNKRQQALNQPDRIVGTKEAKQLLLSETTPGPLGTRSDRGARVAGNSKTEPDIDCLTCIVLCMLDLPSGDWKYITGSLCKSQIAAYHFAGLSQEEATTKGTADYANYVKDGTKLFKWLCTIVLYGKLEIEIIKVLPDSPSGKKSFGKVKVTIDTYKWTALENLRWKIIKMLTKKIAAETLDALFKKVLVPGYNVLSWILTIQKGSECCLKCAASAARLAIDRFAKTASKILDELDSLLSGFFDWLASEFGKGYSALLGKIDPDKWKWHPQIPTAAKTKINSMYTSFKLWTLLPPTLESLTTLSSRTLASNGITELELRNAAEGIVEVYYFAGQAKSAEQKKKDIDKILQDIKPLSPSGFVDYLENLNTIPIFQF